jgi:branched-chain amino acid transport system permease protein
MTDFLQLIIAGVAIGLQYALVALGFVVIFKATHVINFAQGAFVMLGAYLAYQFSTVWGLPFPVGVLLSIVLVALVGIIVERLILRKMVGQPAFALIMITFGLVFIIAEFCATIWGYDALNLGDPWGIDTVAVGGLVIQVKNIWATVLASVVLSVFFLFFRFSKLGLAMRASALDQEAALAQGMSASRVVMTAWAIAGGVAALAGVIIAAGPGQLSPTIQFVALLAFPALILGGVDSPGGAVLGGIIIGITQTLTAGYQGTYAPFLGENFQSVMPYVVMLLILLIRPYGLFGTREVKRI